MEPISKDMKEALLYEKIGDGRVQCGLCSHRCQIAPEKRGICAVRENRDGTLYSLVYGRIIARNIDPIEKNPFFIFSRGPDPTPSRRSAAISAACTVRTVKFHNIPRNIRASPGKPPPPKRS